ncbi:winged helix-turn-helix transcriptional regulator, partial [Candidatus Woesearchaeota archaeon]|nr:winged helix-turn-helix transcriptional regulator [Candidatus Woesearchaeota archaeon]
MTKITKVIFFDEKPEDLKQFVQSTFSKIHEELEEHLDAINENTNEIQANYEYLCELDKKIQHLQEEIKQLKNIISEITGQPIQSKPEIHQIQPLTQEEQKVFLALYSESKPISYLELAQKLNLSLTLIRTYVTNLISKGIP